MWEYSNYMHTPQPKLPRLHPQVPQSHAGLGASGKSPERVAASDLHHLPGLARRADPPWTLQAQEAEQLSTVGFAINR